MRIKSLGFGAVVFLALGVAAGCSTSDDSAPDPYDPSPSPSGEDAGPSTHDGGSDATLGGNDAGHDSGGHDAGADTSTGPDTGTDAGDGDADTSDAGTDATDVDANDAGTDAAGDDAGDDAGDGGGTDAAAGDAGDDGGDAGSTSDASDDGGDGGLILPSPIGKWSFEDGTGTTAADSSGNGHAATLKGAATWTTSGKVGSALALDGATGYADVGLALVDTTKAFTVSCWVSLGAVNNWEAAISEDDVNGSLFGLKLRGDGSNQFDFDVETSDVMSPGFVVAQSKTTATASTWTHLTGVYDATGTGALVLYVNGAQEAKTAVGQTLLGATGHLLIGRGLYNGAVGSYLNGAIDEVEVRNVALTDAQVKALYDATK